MKLYQLRSLRRVLLPLFARLNPGDISIRHHYTGDRFRLHSFLHKGYWYHGRNRERETMALFERLVRPGDTVIEVGGHIGYITLYFRQLARDGRVVVFEPGENSLPYLRRNIAGKPGVRLVEMAVGDQSGEVEFYLDPLTGQNNSCIRDFERLRDNTARAFVRDIRVRTVKVPMVRLDDFVQAEGLAPDFLKIDVEGYELGVLRGAEKILSSKRPAVMVEVQADHQAIFDLLRAHGYRLFNANLVPLLTPASMKGNVFCLSTSWDDARTARIPLPPDWRTVAGV